MIDAGLPLLECLDILGRQEEDKNFGKTILDVRASVESGASRGRDESASAHV